VSTKEGENDLFRNSRVIEREKNLTPSFHRTTHGNDNGYLHSVSVPTITVVEPDAGGIAMAMSPLFLAEMAFKPPKEPPKRVFRSEARSSRIVSSPTFGDSLVVVQTGFIVEQLPPEWHASQCRAPEDC